jgi:hypothetical protein
MPKYAITILDHSSGELSKPDCFTGEFIAEDEKYAKWEAKSFYAWELDTDVEHIEIVDIKIVNKKIRAKRTVGAIAVL